MMIIKLGYTRPVPVFVFERYSGPSHNVEIAHGILEKDGGGAWHVETLGM